MTTVCAIAPKVSSPPPPMPRPVGGGSILLKVHVPEKFAFVCALVMTLSDRASTTDNTARLIIIVSSVGVNLRHQRLRPENVRRGCPGPWYELLWTPAEDFRGV